MVSFAWNRTGSTDLAREHVQELFTRVWIKRHLLAPEKQIKAYLYTALNNIIINYNKLHVNKSKSLDSVCLDYMLKNLRDEDIRIDVKYALKKLPDKVREVFLMSRIDKFSYAEIAEICNISIKTVEKRMSKAIYLLRKLFNSKI